MMATGAKVNELRVLSVASAVSLDAAISNAASGLPALSSGAERYRVCKPL